MSYTDCCRRPTRRDVPSRLDVARDQTGALRTIIELGCERVLTFGGEAIALAAAARIAEFVEQARSQIVVMAGAGINARNVHEVAARSHVREFHAPARGVRVSTSHRRNDRLPELSADWREADAGVVREIADALS